MGNKVQENQKDGGKVVVKRFLEFTGTIPTMLKNVHLFRDNPFYCLTFEPGELKTIVEDAFNDISMIPNSIAVQYAKRHCDVLKITEVELDDEEFVSQAIKELISNYDMGLVKTIVTEMMFPELVSAKEAKKVVEDKINEVMSSEPPKSKNKTNAHKKHIKSTRKSSKTQK
jgi:DNA gyrase/topoisomerase IV subunit B